MNDSDRQVGDWLLEGRLSRRDNAAEAGRISLDDLPDAQEQLV